MGVIYVVWGSTYLAIRIMVESVPPLLGSGARFATAGVLVLVVMGLLRGASALLISREQVGWAFAVGTLLTGGNAVVTVAERDVPSALAALLIATVPLCVILLRRVAGESASRSTVTAVLVGFAGVALLLRPGAQNDASVWALLAVVLAAGMWACGSFASPRVSLPPNAFASTGWQMVLGGLTWMAAGLLAGEGATVDFAAYSIRSLLAFGYLIVFGSLLAFTTYVWLLQRAPLSQVATYAYVNPVVAILLGWLILSERMTSTTLIAAAVIVGSVAFVVRGETSPSSEEECSAIQAGANEPLAVESRA